MDKNSRKLRVYTGGHSWLHPPLHTCPSVLVTLTTVAVNAPMTSTLHALLHLLQRWASIRVKWEQMEECWEAVERALPGRGRRTLRLLEQNLVSVRKRVKMSKDAAPHTYCLAPIDQTPTLLYCSTSCTWSKRNVLRATYVEVEFLIQQFIEWTQWLNFTSGPVVTSNNLLAWNQGHSAAKVSQ